MLNPCHCRGCFTWRIQIILALGKSRRSCACLLGKMLPNRFAHACWKMKLFLDPHIQLELNKRLYTSQVLMEWNCSTKIITQEESWYRSWNLLNMNNSKYTENKSFNSIHKLNSCHYVFIRRCCLLHSPASRSHPKFAGPISCNRTRGGYMRLRSSGYNSGFRSDFHEI